MHKCYINTRAHWAFVYHWLSIVLPQLGHIFLLHQNNTVELSPEKNRNTRQMAKAYNSILCLSLIQTHGCTNKFSFSGWKNTGRPLQMSLVYTAQPQSSCCLLRWWGHPTIPVFPYATHRKRLKSTWRTITWAHRTSNRYVGNPVPLY